MSKLFTIISVLVVMLLVAACTPQQFSWWEQQGDEPEVRAAVGEFCGTRQDYCRSAGETLIASTGSDEEPTTTTLPPPPTTIPPHMGTGRWKYDTWLDNRTGAKSEEIRLAGHSVWSDERYGTEWADLVATCQGGKFKVYVHLNELIFADYDTNRIAVEAKFDDGSLETDWTAGESTTYYAAFLEFPHQFAAKVSGAQTAKINVRTSGHDGTWAGATFDVRGYGSARSQMTTC